MVSGPPLLLRKHFLMSFRMMRLCKQISRIPTWFDLKTLLLIKPRPPLSATTIALFQLDWVCFTIPSILFEAKVWIVHWTERLVVVVLELLPLWWTAVINLNSGATCTCPGTALHTPPRFPTCILPPIITLPVQAKSGGGRGTNRRAWCGAYWMLNRWCRWYCWSGRNRR